MAKKDYQGLSKSNFKNHNKNNKKHHQQQKLKTHNNVGERPPLSYDSPEWDDYAYSHDDF